MPNPIFTFETTHHALWAEEIAAERGIACAVVPTPPEAGARCNLALEVLPGERGAMTAALRDSGVPFEVHERGP